MSYLTKKDLAERIYGIERYRPGDPSTQHIHMAVSSGTTTGRPTLVALYRPDRPGGEVHNIWIANLGRHVRLPQNRLGALQVVRRALTSNSIERFLTLDERDLEEKNLPLIVNEYRPQTMRASSSQVLRFGETLAGTDSHALKNIRLIQLIAELCTSTQKKRLRALFPEATLQSGYMLSEVVYPTIQCLGTEGEERYHLLEDSETVLSIAEPDEEGVGEIIATTSELKNYRTGDLGKVDTNPCPCGKQPTLLLHGRKDFDIVPILGALFLREELERVLEPVADKLVEYQLRVGEIQHNGKLVGKAVFDFVPRNDALTDAEMGKYLAESLFVTKTRTLSQLIEAGIFVPFVARQVVAIASRGKKIVLKRDPAI